MVMVTLRGCGIIPAYAGSTNSSSHLLSFSGDHPRIRGEHFATRRPRISMPGSSPHTRGARRKYQQDKAWRSDHPRIRGEHTVFPVDLLAGLGSSPHTRGAPTRTAVSAKRWRIIPAYAGSTSICQWTPPPSRDHPRIRGEHIGTQSRDLTCRGSSPHTRGAQAARSASASANGIIPAYAGSTPHCSRET